MTMKLLLPIFLLAILTEVCAAAAKDQIRIDSGAATGIFLGFFLVMVAFTAITLMLGIQTPDAIGRSFKKED